ncbi:ribokinase [Alisedimentitalea sp. MJ-SS2]|uniref:ribokinase n=1 Tax=Aliisedimentitalea sp. MJ-SS2 TaxID=3049795 RepID=UPI00290B1468|nr:ribokinase [Alisedimentitalea sp. MJ-SS2]MDU8927907.1 ribokinase [Alisedimentitalea sp. MJ-SS2]
MTIYNLGSINADLFYSVPHLPRPGETLAATGHSTGLGGKGANQSVAAALAGSSVVHIGAVGLDGAWAVQRLREFGVDTAHVSTVDAPTAHAIINVDPQGENAIVIFSGANIRQSLTQLKSTLSAASSGDSLMLQNETNLQVEAAQEARRRGLQVIYSAAPFDAQAVQEMLPHTDVLVMNAVEAGQLSKALSIKIEDLSVAHVLITRGSQGAAWHDLKSGEVIEVPAHAVTPVDTTGAGDCFIGYVVAGLDQGMSAEEAMRLGSAASAIHVTRPGTADAIPARDEVDALMNG